MSLTPLNEEEKKTYEWQMWVPDFGEAGQEALKGATVMISRVGGLGSVVAYELAAAGVGTMVLAHGGNVKHSDLNRQLLMTYDWIGKPRIETVSRRLKDMNPRLNLILEGSNVNADNVAGLVEQADLIIDCAPLFEERYLMNAEAQRQQKPLIECAMYELEAFMTCIRPGQDPCLRCLFPEKPPHWKRQFPVFGAVSGMIGCMGAMEAIKIISGLGEPLYGQMLRADLRDVTIHKHALKKRPDCPDCS